MNVKKMIRCIRAFPYQSGGVFGVGYNQKVIKDKNLWLCLTDMASLWENPRDRKAVFNRLLRKGFNAEVINQSYHTLEKNNFFSSSMSSHTVGRYSRNELFFDHVGGNPSEVQNRLQSASVVLLGCGGIGGQVASILAAAGVGKLILVDADKVEPSNLNRQTMFNERDVGKYKINALSRELKKKNACTSIQRVRKIIRTEQDLKAIPSNDLIVLSADTPCDIIDRVNSFCVGNKTPYINVGYMNDISVIGPFYIPTRTSCFRCNGNIAQDTRLPVRPSVQKINRNFIPASYAPVNHTAAAYACNDIVRYLGGFGQILSANKRVGIHSQKLKIEIQKIEKNKSCSICQIN